MFNAADQLFSNVASGIGNFIGNGVSAIGGLYDAYTNPSKAKITYSNPKGVSYNSRGTSSGSSGNDWMAEQRAYEARIRALEAERMAAPRLPDFDILGNYNRAKQQASAAVNPMYQRKLNNALAEFNLDRSTNKKQAKLSKENNKIAMNQALEDNQTSRVRTGEDLASALEQIGQVRS